MKRLGVLASMLVLLSSIAHPAGAEAAGGSTSKVDPWGTNTACAVVSPTDVRCYPTEADMQAATSPAALGESGTAAGIDSVTAYCGGRSDLWLYLYENANFGGRVLKFRDTNLWQNLSVWGFSNTMSSWRNDTFCTTWAADGDNGAGEWLTLSASSSNSYVGATWNDRVSSIYIVG